MKKNCLISLSLLALAGTSQAQIAYQYVDLSAALGSPVGSGQAINNIGQIIYSGRQLNTFPLTTAFQLPSFAGFTQGVTAAALTDSGHIAGTGRVSNTNTGDRAFYWSPSNPSVTVNLGFTSGGTRSAAHGINSSFDVVGVTRVSNTSSTETATLFDFSGSSHTPTNLHPAPSRAYDINDTGTIVGYARPGGATKDQPVVFLGGGLATQLPLPAGDAGGLAQFVNNAGLIGGSTFLDTEATRKAVIWTSSGASATTLPDPPGILGSTKVLGLTNTGLILGNGSLDFSNFVTLLWSGGVGYRVPDFVVNPPAANIALSSPTAINDAGVIIGSARVTDSEGGVTLQGFLLVPTTAPTGVTVNGKFNLQGWAGTKSPGSFTLNVTPQIGSPETVVVPVGADGTFTYSTNLFGTATIDISGGSTFLNRRVVVGLNGANVNIDILNGDANDDQSVDLLDYFALSDSYNLVLGDPNYNAGADFNGDDSVDLLDYFVLSDSYNLSGDF